MLYCGFSLRLTYCASNFKFRFRQVYEIDKSLFLIALTLATHAGSLISTSTISVKDVPFLPSVDEWIKNMWCINTAEIKKNEILSFEVT